ncbi:MAG: bifunctional 4-hydroxy-2-oxoglutarate aldolase/2-dehydro-3-deoxy-phosphogluconate aldolase [Thermoanaerobaculia bacterium]
MKRAEELFGHVRQQGIVAVIREDSASSAWELVRCVAENEMTLIEITMTTPDAIPLIEKTRERYGGRGIVVAAGTVRTNDEAAAARRAGAEIIVSPHTDLRLIDYAMEHDLLCVAGALTATEIIHAWEAGAGATKIYPARHVGGAGYIRAIRQPIRGIPMIAGGPIDLEEISSYLEAGAIAVNLGGCLAPPEVVREKKWDEVARRVRQAVSIARSHLETTSSAVVH